MYMDRSPRRNDKLSVLNRPDTIEIKDFEEKLNWAPLIF